MLTPAPIYAFRARWHYLFPEGLQEVYPRPGGKDEVTKYTPAVCRRLVETFDGVQRAGAAHGMAPQPIPVQLQHAGVVGSDNIHDLRRVGSLYALTYHGGNNGIPRGVWGLIEWTPEGWSFITDRKFNTLSPTTAPYVRMSDGSKMAGPVLVEVGLVDNPFFQQIGTVLDCLPAVAFPYSGPRTLIQSSDAPTMESVDPRSLRHYPLDLVLSRGAISRSEVMEDENKVELELTPDRFTPELVEAIMSSPAARKCMRAMMSEAFDEVATERGYMKREAMNIATPTMPINDMTAPDAAPADESFTERAKRAERELIEKEAMGLIADRKLLAIRSGEYLDRRTRGVDVSDMLADYSAVTRMAGNGGGVVKENGPKGPVQKRSANAIVTEVQDRLERERKYTAAEHLRLANAEIEAARVAGTLED